MNKILLVPTSYKFYWGGIADYKVLASNLALNVSTRKCFKILNKTYMYIVHHLKKGYRFMIPLSFLLFILIFVVVLSCDPVFRTEIVNKTNSDILIEIKFDKAEIESVWQGRPYIDYIRGVLNGGGILIYFDTINLVSNLKINPEESYTLEGGIGARPDFFGVKYIRVCADDTLFLDNKDKMKKAFLETDLRKYQLIIK